MTIKSPKLLRERMSGVLLHPTSLPGPGPIGTLGDSAYRFIDFLAEARQRLWQMLPIVPAGPGGTPYIATSAFAGNTMLLDPEALVAGGFLTTFDLPSSAGSDCVDFAAAKRQSDKLVRQAFARFADSASETLRREFASFCEKQADWLRDYSLFSALNEKLALPWQEWPEGLANRNPEALWKARGELESQTEFFSFGQFLFDRQWRSIKRYAQERGILLVGDIPIYVSLDSADCWANQEIFALDEKGYPTEVAGVPPDYFSATGQRWGNPLYRWDVLAKRHYNWWVRRFRRTFDLFDIVRVDHFRGFESYWSIPASEPTAIVGQWLPGPGLDLFERLAEELGELNVIAEDLGIITDEVHALRTALGFPGMCILQFAFADEDGEEPGQHPYLPANHTPSSVVYPGTHDNNTTLGWYLAAEPDEREAVANLLGEAPERPAWAFVEMAWGSVANLAIAALQDLLELDASARMNVPGMSDGNWQWRALPGAWDQALADRLAALTITTGRAKGKDSA